MSWRCDFCDTYNEDEALECSVCGQPRSSASIAEERRARRQERIEKIFDKAYLVARYAFFAALIVVLIAVVVDITRRLTSGSFEDLLLMAAVMVERVKSQVVYWWKTIVPQFFRSLGAAAFVSVPGNAVAAWDHASANVAILFAPLPSIWEQARSRCVYTFFNTLLPLIRHAGVNLGILAAAAAAVFASAKAFFIHLLNLAKIATVRVFTRGL
ncbi:MAG: hypothetical protein IKO83_09910 [Oscillospiraceae bacterium]|nr:hypothetical protein [Oscillospiraceae bacterium]